MTTCIVTGGAGFIGCATSSLLADRFDRVVALDVLHPAVHAVAQRPAALDPRVELRIGDVTDAGVWDALLADVRADVVLHLAAETGTGVSLTEATRHAHVNVVGTTQMLDAFVRHDALPSAVVLTSSRAVYGEGAWVREGVPLVVGQRSRAQLERQEWQPAGAEALPHRADRVEPRPTSVYGATKLAQEHVLGAWALAMGVTPVVLRLQNVYGPGQSLTNPYTGIVPLFARLAREGLAVPVYEDGAIVRDFVHVTDVAAALAAAVDAATTGGALPEGPVDIGSGVPTTVLELARTVAGHYGAPAPVVTGQFRDGDVRYACADPAAAAGLWGWRPTVGVSEGVRALCAWIDEGSAA
jgi:dTDP-L-rhamnose 4-epimerase